jgi:hypothetical protein
MPSSKYHREQAKILASLALSTRDALEAEQFNIAAMGHLERAEAMDESDDGPPHAQPAPISSAKRGASIQLEYVRTGHADTAGSRRSGNLKQR